MNHDERGAGYGCFVGREDASHAPDELGLACTQFTYQPN